MSWCNGEAKGESVACVALAWLLAKPHVSSIIIGAKNEEQLSDNLAASDLVLDSADLAALDEMSVLPSEYLGWMIERLLGLGRAPKNAR